MEIAGVEWLPNPDDPGTLSFQAHYGVRPPGMQSIKGAEDVMVALCQQLSFLQQRGCAAISEVLPTRDGSWHGLFNARSEATNTHLRLLTRRAYGYRSNSPSWSRCLTHAGCVPGAVLSTVRSPTMRNRWWCPVQ